MRAAIVLLSLLYCATALGQASYPLDVKAFGMRQPNVDKTREIGRRIAEGDVIWYKLRRVYQHYTPAQVVEKRYSSTGRVVVEPVDAKWGVYDVSFRPELNANNDYPWEDTVGFNAIEKDERLTKIYQKVNFLMLPRDERGKLKPICIVYHMPLYWVFPVGTIGGEVVLVRQDGQWWPQEIRARQKTEFSVTWEPIVERTVEDRDEFTQLLMKGQDYDPAKRWFHFRNPEESQVMKMEGFVERLPDLKPETVKMLLSRKFKDVTYTPWSDISHAPTADQDFSIVPRNYTFGLIHPDVQNCAECHRQAGISVRELIPEEPIIRKNFEIVGNIRGSDGIFSWHPFDDAMIHTSEVKSQQVVFRDYDLKNGIIKIWDPRKDEALDESVYKLTEYVERSLPKYQLPHPKFLHGVKLEVPSDVATK